MSEPKTWYLEWFEIDEKEPMIECNVYHIKPKHWSKKPTAGQVEIVGRVDYDTLQKAYDELWMRYQNDLRELGREEMIAETEHALSLILNKGEGDETNSV